MSAAKRRCPACGREVYREPDIGMFDYSCLCGWEDGGPEDYGFVAMEARPFCPEPLDGVAP